MQEEIRVRKSKWCKALHPQNSIDLLDDFTNSSASCLFTLYETSPELQKYKDLLEHPAKIEDACLSIVGGI